MAGQQSVKTDPSSKSPANPTSTRQQSIKTDPSSSKSAINPPSTRQQSIKTDPTTKPPASSMEPIDEKLLNRVIRTLLKENAQQPLNPDDIKWMIDRTTFIFQSEPSLVPVQTPVSICGDIHGQFSDLKRLLQTHQWPPKMRSSSWVTTLTEGATTWKRSASCSH